MTGVMLCQIELLNGIKQKSKTIVVDDNTDKRKKPISHGKKNANSDKKVKNIKPKGSQNTNMSRKYCMMCKQFGGIPRSHSTKDYRIYMKHDAVPQDPHYVHFQ
eukprot:1491395-Ditylum_brightwellii.AAC.1